MPCSLIFLRSYNQLFTAHESPTKSKTEPAANGRPFIAANRPLEKGSHGGWEGTFAARHGGYPHMFESLAPSKSRRWLGQTDVKTVSALPVLVPYASKGGPGYAHRAIATDEPYMSDPSHDAVERLNRQVGYCDIFP